MAVESTRVTAVCGPSSVLLSEGCEGERARPPLEGGRPRLRVTAERLCAPDLCPPHRSRWPGSSLSHFQMTLGTLGRVTVKQFFGDTWMPVSDVTSTNKHPCAFSLRCLLARGHRSPAERMALSRWLPTTGTSCRTSELHWLPVVVLRSSTHRAGPALQLSATKARPSLENCLLRYFKPRTA